MADRLAVLPWASSRPPSSGSEARRRSACTASPTAAWQAAVAGGGEGREPVPPFCCRNVQVREAPPSTSCCSAAREGEGEDAEPPLLAGPGPGEGDCWPGTVGGLGGFGGRAEVDTLWVKGA